MLLPTRYRRLTTCVSRMFTVPIAAAVTIIRMITTMITATTMHIITIMPMTTIIMGMIIIIRHTPTRTIRWGRRP